MFAVILLVSNSIGSIPLFIAILLKTGSDPSVISKLASNPSDFTVLGLNPNLGLIMMLFPFIAGLFAFIILVRPLNHRTLKMIINGTKKIR